MELLHINYLIKYLQWYFVLLAILTRQNGISTHCPDSPRGESTMLSKRHTQGYQHNINISEIIIE